MDLSIDRLDYQTGKITNTFLGCLAFRKYSTSSKNCEILVTKLQFNIILIIIIVNIDCMHSVLLVSTVTPQRRVRNACTFVIHFIQHIILQTSSANSPSLFQILKSAIFFCDDLDLFNISNYALINNVLRETFYLDLECTICFLVLYFTLLCYSLPSTKIKTFLSIWKIDSMLIFLAISKRL